MKNLLNPIWIFLLNTLPVSILLLLGLGQFNIIKSLLTPENIAIWQYLAIALLSIWVINIGYAIYAISKKHNISLCFSIINIVAAIALLYLYFYNIDKIIPFDQIPQWMMSDNMILYMLAFLMPSIAHYMALIVIYLTPNDKENRPWINFLIALSIPLAVYLFVNIIIPLFSCNNFETLQGKFMQHTITVLFISITVIFFFFLTRGIYIVASSKDDFFGRYQFVIKVFVALIFPILGLLLNHGIFDNSIGINIFGNFTNVWFYILALLNGVLMIMPAKEDKIYRTLLFIGRSITFIYTLYFFLVFLPFLPVSIIAIVVFGAGFLMLTPLMLLLIHASELSKDFVYLKHWYSSRKLSMMALSALLVIPASVTGVYLNDKRVLNRTLQYIYTPDYNKDYRLNVRSLERTINTIRSHKNANGQNLFSQGSPFLSPYFNWLVMDNMMLSDKKIADIENIFFGKNDASQDRFINDNSENKAQITNINTNSKYDENQHVWRSWIDLELTNKSGFGLAEYSTSFELPEGCWISDYYLYVGDKKEFGILSEKKAAMWIYSQIRNERRDPGILHYLTGNRIMFKVFPFSSDEVRKTGIELIHREPTEISLDGYTITLGDPKYTTAETIETADVIYLSSSQKAKLDSVSRKPYFHFLVDASSYAKGNIEGIIERINNFIAHNKEFADSAKISFVGSYVTTVAMSKDWEQSYRSQSFAGGFFLDRAVRKALLQSYGKNSYPLLVAVSDSLDKAVIYIDFADLSFAFPESPLFYLLTDSVNLEPHSLVIEPLNRVPDTIVNAFRNSVLAYRTEEGDIFYLPDNNQPSIVLKNNVLNIGKVEEKAWLSALMMQAQWRTHIVAPDISEKGWVDLVRNSFTAKIMMPPTSYLVVENEAQKAMLARKQRQVLAGNKSLDLGEDEERMSEPSMIVLALIVAFVLWCLERRKKLR